MYAYRIRQMLADKKPVIAPIDQNDWAKYLGYTETPPAELVALYGLNRHANLRLLQRLKPSDLEKSAYHPELKTNVTVADYVEKMGTHGASHLEQIERLKKKRHELRRPCRRRASTPAAAQMNSIFSRTFAGVSFSLDQWLALVNAPAPPVSELRLPNQSISRPAAARLPDDQPCPPPPVPPPHSAARHRAAPTSCR